MYEVNNIPFGNVAVDVEAQNFLDMMYEVDRVKNLGKDAKLVADYVRFFYDEEPEVRPRFSDDEDNNTYYGFICENTGVNITFKIDQNGEIYPGRYAALENGNNSPKLYDPRMGYDEILNAVDENTDFIRRHGVRLPQGGQQPQQQPRQGGGQQPQQGGNPTPNQNGTRNNPTPSRGGNQSGPGGQQDGNPAPQRSGNTPAPKSR